MIIKPNRNDAYKQHYIKYIIDNAGTGTRDLGNFRIPDRQSDLMYARHVQILRCNIGTTI